MLVPNAKSSWNFSRPSGFKDPDAQLAVMLRGKSISVRNQGVIDDDNDDNDDDNDNDSNGNSHLRSTHSQNIYLAFIVSASVLGTKNRMVSKVRGNIQPHGTYILWQR